MAYRRRRDRDDRAHGGARAPEGAGSAKPLPVAMFAEEPFITDPVLSPDGKTIAAVSTAGGKTSLYAFAIADMKLDAPRRSWRCGHFGDRMGGHRPASC